MKLKYSLLLLLLITFISCANEQRMKDFVQCAKDQIGKTYLEGVNARGPTEFSNSGLIWYCRDVANFPKASTIYVSWRDVKKPVIGAYVYGIIKQVGDCVTTDSLGIIVSLNPTMVVAGDPEKGILTKHRLQFEKEYIRVEYLYVDF